MLLAAPSSAEPQTDPKPIRRVVTGHRDGKSVFLTDGAAPHVYQCTAESVRITELWETNSAPADIASEGDPADRPLHLEPPANGSTFRVLEFLPESQQKAALAKELAAGDDGSGIVDALKRGASSRAPGFHKTDTIDYVVLLSREIHALMDEGELRLEAGDVLVQRGAPGLHSHRRPSRRLNAEDRTCDKF
jgi:hypothetical protein